VVCGVASECCILVKKLEKTEGKMQSNCDEGYFAGLENHLFLIKLKDSNEVYKVSRSAEWRLWNANSANHLDLL
jgi:hypothetical protein